MGTRFAGVRRGCVRLALLALSWGCSTATHTVGQLAPERERATPAANGSSATNGGASSSGTAGAQSPGDVITLDAGSGTSSDAAAPDPVAILGDAAFSCRGTATPAVRRRLDMFLMIDTNLFTVVGSAITTPLNTTFTEIIRGLSEYVDDERAGGTGVGTGFFPAPVAPPSSGPACDPDTYAVPAAIVDLLPDNAAAIKRSIPVPLGLGSPTLPALQGAIRYSRSRWQSWPYKQVVVLITDKLADFACSFDSSAIVDAAADAAQGSPPVPTYVVALSAPVLEQALSGFVRFEALDEVAAEGGTGHVRDVNLDDRNASLADTLLEIQHDAEPCQYEVGDDVSADPTGIALGTQAPGSDALPLARLDSATDCGQGYYFDDPGAPKWATLCTQTCAALKASTRSVTWIDDCQMP